MPSFVGRISLEDWGYYRIGGELLKLGHTIDNTTTKHILNRALIVPAPERRKRSNSRE